MIAGLDEGTLATYCRHEKFNIAGLWRPRRLAQRLEL